MVVEEVVVEKIMVDLVDQVVELELLAHLKQVDLLHNLD